MYQFRVCVHPLDTGFTHAESPAAGSPRVFAATFDRVLEILQTLPRMFIEPDGSFVWTGEHDGESWQVDGVLYDAGPSLSYVELSGRCPPNEFDQFLAALGWPAAPVMFQVIEAGEYVSEEAFRRCAQR